MFTPPTCLGKYGLPQIWAAISRTRSSKEAHCFFAISVPHFQQSALADKAFQEKARDTSARSSCVSNGDKVMRDRRTDERAVVFKPDKSAIEQVIDARREKLRMALPWCFLEDPLDDASADTEFLANLENAIPFGSQFNYLSFHRRLYSTAS